MKGKEGGNVSIFMAYWPWIAHGPLTNYQQQQRYLSTINMSHKCPWDVFWEDLTIEVAEAQSQGDIVIVMADVNEDIKGTTTQKQLRHMGLVEAITFLHKETLPNIHQQHGQVLIDGIFVSPILLDGARGGYLAFDDILGSDHCSIWMDIPASILWGMAQYQQTQAKASWLQCKDPCIMKKYNNNLQIQLMEKQIFTWANTLAQKINGMMPAKQEQEFEQLNKEIMEAKSRQKDNANKLKQTSMGGHQN